MPQYKSFCRTNNINKDNWVKCGRCGTEFDLNKNDGCPLCGFGNKVNFTSKQLHEKRILSSKKTNYLKIPDNNLKLTSKGPIIDFETQAVGSWGMFNSFFPGKAVLRVLANMLQGAKTESISLDELVNTISQVIEENGLTAFRGFPNNPKKENSIRRLVNHFIKTFARMGLLIAYSKEGDNNHVWKENWSNIQVTPTLDGLNFAKLKNNLLDNYSENQILTKEEKDWVLEYLKKIDKKGYREYSLLKEVYTFIKEGHNGKDELWCWFRKNRNFRDYIKKGSRKADDPEGLKKQMETLSTTFSAGKLALLRELGFIANKRNDYTVIGDF